MTKPKCECDEIGNPPMEMAALYDPITELPFVNHKPGECKCTNDLKQYKRNGKIIWLCSCCHMNGDKLVY